jgi:gliding motility-associated-like protein/uncharacterized repeat protein (TIGR01451 family)
MNKRPLFLVFLVTTVPFLNNLFGQTVDPFSLRFQTSAKGSIDFVSNASIECDGTGGGGANCVDLAAQLPPIFAAWSQNNDHNATYIDIDGNPSTFSSTSDSLNLPLCSEVLFAAIYWGGRSDNGDPGFANRGNIKIKTAGGSYVDVTASETIDATIGNRVYYCFADITDYIKSNPTKSMYTVGNVYSRLGGSNMWAGWNIVVVYKNDLFPMRNLNVFDGLVNVNSAGTNVEVGITDFLTPPSGPVTFEVGVYAYEGDRGFVGDSLLFDGGSGYVAISNGLNPVDDIFNFSQSRNGAVSNSQIPLIHNNISIDADIFAPNNVGFPYIGNSETEANVKITTSNETIMVQVITLAIDVYEPDMRAGVRVEDLNGGDVEPGDILEYTVVGSNIGSDPATNSYIVDTLAPNITFVPGSIEIIHGPNLGVKTDGAGDDQGSYLPGPRVVRLNIGTGATGASGGVVLNSPSGVDSTVFIFRAQAIDDCVNLSCDNVVENQAFIFGTGTVSGNEISNISNPGVLDADGCPVIGTTSILINISDCVLPPDTTVAGYCSGVLFSSFPYDELGYAYYNTSFVVVPAAVGPGIYYAIRTPFAGCSDTIVITVTTFFAPPTTSNAGPDHTGCISPGTATLAGNNPFIGTGLWTVVSGGATVTSPTLFNSGVTGLTVGVNTFRWTITNGPCAASLDDVIINVSAPPTPAAAGTDQLLCLVTSTTLAGNNPLVGTGLWTVITEDGTVTTPTLFNSGVTGLTPGINTFRWTISTPGCPPSFDDVVISFDPDSDGDGICDEDDLDDDNDGIPDLEEGVADTDGDGVIDALDLDSDNDGIPDIVEAGGDDTDGDGSVDGFEDLDGDGLDDGIEADPLYNPDSDDDGIVDAKDLDSDNDGIPDVIEAGGTDVDGDGVLDGYTDVDGDGFADSVDTDNDLTPGAGDGGVALENPDTDGDGVDDRLDLDSDNDGIPDVTENGGTDVDGDGVLDGYTDVDSDGFADFVDTDDNTVLGPGDGGTSLPIGDADLDGVPNYLDLDSDNDGILDLVEAGGTDADGNGRIDDFADVDADGFADAVDTDDNTTPGPDDGGTSLEIPNTDGTGGADYLDIDADGDGIVDNLEGQPSDDYTAATGTDADGDGIDDAYDVDAGGSPIGDYDHDGDGAPDYVDLDSDNDGEGDAIEGNDLDGDGVADTVPTGTDSDNDGLDDAFDKVILTPDTAFTNAGNGIVDPLTDGTFGDTDAPGIGDLDFRETDYDNDGIPDAADLDDDNDGIPDLVEDLDEDGDNDPTTNPTDTDGDGISDMFDLDSDNDGIADIVEAGGVDDNGDGRADAINPDGTLINDTDNDGLDDLYDGDNGGADIPNTDTDGDGHSDFQDVDSDNDGIYDVVEDSGVDEDNDGRVDDWLDSDVDGIPDYADVDATGGIDLDGDGIDDAVQVGDDEDDDGIADDFDEDANGDGWDDDDATNGFEDTDGDGVFDRLDLDSDNDGTPDIIEDGGVDENRDGRIDDFTDLDGDGADDDSMTDGLLDTEGDGVPDHEDLDSDNDGITDAEENGKPDDDGDGIIDDFTDLDGDGWDDDHQTTDPVDTDGDGIPDSLDLDSDNDGILDIIESGGTDINGDGAIDYFEDENGDGLDDTDGGVSPPDTDGDGIDDYQDTDSDNDGVLDVEENDPNGDGTGPDDKDGDGIPDYQDTDDDNDGVLTENESDKDENGVYTDCDSDGIPDYLDPNPCGLTIPTGFSPDNDGINDKFIIKGIEAYPNASMTIFNRWGNKVYESTGGYPNDWDGTNQFGMTVGERNLPVGTYFYVLDLGDGSEVVKGFVFINK